MNPRRVPSGMLEPVPEAASISTDRSRQPRPCCPTCGHPLRTPRPVGEPRPPRRSVAELCDAVIAALSPMGTLMTSKEIAVALGYPPRPRLPQELRHVVMSLYWGEVLDRGERCRYRWTGRTRVTAEAVRHLTIRLGCARGGGVGRCTRPARRKPAHRTWSDSRFCMEAAIRRPALSRTYGPALNTEDAADGEQRAAPPNV